MIQLSINIARHEDADALEKGRHGPVHRVSGSKPRCLRTHIHCGRSRPLESTVVKQQDSSTRSETNFPLGVVWQMGTGDARSYQNRQAHRMTRPYLMTSDVQCGIGHQISVVLRSLDTRAAGPCDYAPKESYSYLLFRGGVWEGLAERVAEEVEEGLREGLKQNCGSLLSVVLFHNRNNIHSKLEIKNIIAYSPGLPVPSSAFIINSDGYNIAPCCTTLPE